MFRAIFACALFNSAVAFGGQVRLSSAWDATPPLVVESTSSTVAWLFDEDAYTHQAAIDVENEVPLLAWHAIEDSLNTAGVREQINTSPRIELRDASQQPVAVPLPPAVIGGAAVALLAGSRDIFKRRRRAARTFR